MTHLDQMITDALAQSPDTVVHQLASEVVRLRGWSAEGGRLFHKNCRSCICWNGDMCELISHVCENGEHWRPSTKFVMVHPEVAALADFAEEMRASASRFSVALDAVRADLAARDAEIADLKRGGVVVPELTDEEVDARLYASSPTGPDSDEDWVRFMRRQCRWAYFLAISRLRTIPADRVLGEGCVSVDREEWEAVNEFADLIVPIRDNLSGISWAGRLSDVFAAYDRWYAVRIAAGDALRAQPTQEPAT